MVLTLNENEVCQEHHSMVQGVFYWQWTSWNMDYVDGEVIFFQLHFILPLVSFHYHILPYQKTKVE